MWNVVILQTGEYSGRQIVVVDDRDYDKTITEISDTLKPITGSNSVRIDGIAPGINLTKIVMGYPTNMEAELAVYSILATALRTPKSDVTTYENYEMWLDGPSFVRISRDEESVPTVLLVPSLSTFIANNHDLCATFCVETGIGINSLSNKSPVEHNNVAYPTIETAAMLMRFEKDNVFHNIMKQWGAKVPPVRDADTNVTENKTEQAGGAIVDCGDLTQQDANYAVFVINTGDGTRSWYTCIAPHSKESAIRFFNKVSENVNGATANDVHVVHIGSHDSCRAFVKRITS